MNEFRCVETKRAYNGSTTFLSPSYIFCCPVKIKKRLPYICHDIKINDTLVIFHTYFGYPSICKNCIGFEEIIIYSVDIVKIKQHQRYNKINTNILPDLACRLQFELSSPKANQLAIKKITFQSCACFQWQCNHPNTTPPGVNVKSIILNDVL